MFASTLFADDSDVRDFDTQIQDLLRNGRADEAAEILETTLRALGETSHPVAAMCLACPVAAIELVGWHALAGRIAELDQPDAPVTALGIDLSWPGHIGLQPDENGCLEPCLETNYYTESAYPFASSDRAGLLQGYGPYGSEWQGGMADIDTSLTVRGLGELYGAVHSLVEDGRVNPELDPLDADAMRLGGAFVAVRMHQAVARAVRLNGLPRPMAVIVGSNESYPFYDAPVFSTAESRQFAPESVDTTLLDLSVEEAPAQDDAGTGEKASEKNEPRVAGPIDLPDPDDRVVQISGAALRHQIGQQRASAQAGAPARTGAGGLLRRLFGT